MRWLASRRALPLSPAGRYGPESSSGGIERPLGFPPSSARQPLGRRVPHPPAEVPMAPGQALRPPDWPVSCACWFCPSGTRLPSGPVPGPGVCVCVKKNGDRTMLRVRRRLRSPPQSERTWTSRQMHVVFGM